MRRVRRKHLALGLVGALAMGTEAGAHGLRPAMLELTERADGCWGVRWKVPREGEAGEEEVAAIRPVFPTWCRLEGVMSAPRPFARMSYGTLDCGARGLRGGALSIEGIDEVTVDVVLRVAPLRAAAITEVIRPGDGPWTVPLRARGGLVRRYVSLGVEHILTGWDHVLFVLGLLALVRGARALVATVSAFTLGHSLTLALAALGLVRPAQAPVEAVIALSLLLVATEVVSEDRDGWSARRPWAVAASFGLVHGFGFASALGEAGLDPSRALAAVACFNAGVELGQLGVVFAALLLARALPEGLRGARARTLAGYALGGTAAWLFMERMRAVVGG